MQSPWKLHIQGWSDPPSFIALTFRDHPAVASCTTGTVPATGCCCAGSGTSQACYLREDGPQPHQQGKCYPKSPQHASHDLNVHSLPSGTDSAGDFFSDFTSQHSGQSRQPAAAAGGKLISEHLRACLARTCKPDCRVINAISLQQKGHLHHRNSPAAVGCFTLAVLASQASTKWAGGSLSLTRRSLPPTT